jgi:hypothetical protein
VVSLAPPLREKCVYRSVRFTCGEPTRDCLSVSNDFIDGPDADLTSDKLDYHVTAVFEANRLAKLRWNADPA